MAALAHNPHSFPANDGGLPPPTDPFWQATPRSTLTSQELELLMAAEQIVPRSPRIPQHKTTRVFGARAALRAPTCTHMTMNRIYGAHTCHMCGKVPSIGWVYSCQQDSLLHFQHLASDAEALPVVSDSSDYFEAQAKIAEAIGMSRSVINQMRQGEYSFDQIETLLQQRQHVLEVIAKSQHGSARSTPSIQAPPPQSQAPSENVIASVGTTAAPTIQQANVNGLPMSPAGTPANTPAISTTTTPTKDNKTKKSGSCTYQVCHTCRPFLQDRLHMSFNPVLNNEVPAVTEKEITKLPLLDPSVVCNLGLRETPKPLPPVPMQDITEARMHQVDGLDDDLSTDWTPTTTTSSAFDHDDSDDSVHSYPCVGGAGCPATNGTGLCTHEPRFQQQAFQQRSSNYTRPNHVRGSIDSTSGGTSSTGSSISLPEPKTEPLTPTSPGFAPFGLVISTQLKKQKAATVCGEVENQRSHSTSRSVSTNSSSSVGSEVEVEGGVALTEEGVGSRLPDIATEE